jgi:anhydro-N-acetylmuramic acid kinase
MALKEHHGIGIMSGTSHDGLDLACCRFSEDDEGRWSYAIIQATTIPYPPAWRKKLLSLPDAGGEAITRADRELGIWMGEAARHFTETHRLRPGFIASHGHTIFHDPTAGLTLQIGSGEEIARVCGVPVIYDFRSADVAMGGQGAPLVPLGDKLLFADYGYCLNLGGIANISYDLDGKRIAFDVCPANMMLNYLAERTGMPYDEGGRTAAAGTLLPGLLEKLESLPFYKLRGPRSLGREYACENIFPLLNNNPATIPDLLRTCTEHIALRVAAVADNKNKDRMLITGGGAWNDFLLDRIRHHGNIDLVVPGAALADYKEAMIFALLGLLRLQNRVNILGSVTGSERDHSSGRIIIPR